MPVRVGTAGWSYKDWYGIVYPRSPPSGFKELDYLSRYFDTLEINSTFYHPANLYMGQAWVRKVSANPDFKFTAKIWRRFTHERKPYGPAEVALYCQGIDPLAEAGRLGAVLCQFPWSFKNSEESREWLTKVLDDFRAYPLVVELRHASWGNEAVYDLLDRKKAGIACIDQPVIGKSLSFKPVRTGSIGYVRMHGRNYKTWFAKSGDNSPERSPSSRYDYLYTGKEIKEIAEKVKTVNEGAQESYVIQNNHPWGQAVANAMQLKAALGETDIRAPHSLIERFPDLSGIARPED
jgi:uncharacterized protein YecE (DUF72 family)